jgi:2-polyprenyl-3-methyl-5-hydroxy-6-metoxy-1,4-benzoquinol methylase
MSSLASISKPSAGPEAYRAKDDQYFAGARKDYVAMLPRRSDARILEIGCGNGDTGALALREGRCGVYCGIELCERAAGEAATKLTEALTGDVERIAFPWPDEHFDAAIISEVLEHLVDPWAVLRKIRPKMKRGGLVLSSSPNVSHYSVIAMLLRGKWDLADQGIMDRTHLRWFTIQSYRRMFEDSGFEVIRAAPLTAFGPRASVLNAITLGKLSHLFARQVSVVARRPEQ